MTYIVAGKLANYPFLMVDSIVSVHEPNNDKYSYFKNKLRKLASSNDEVYYCLIGTATILDILTEYDSWLNRNGDSKNLYSTKYFMSGFKTVLQNSLSIDTFSQLNCIDNRLYFISEKSLMYYQIRIEKKNKVFISQKIEIENNKYLGVHINDNNQRPINNISDYNGLKEFCKTIIVNSANGIDFKDRFSFIFFGDNVIQEYPDKTFSDNVNGIFKNDFETLDDVKYNWNI